LKLFLGGEWLEELDDVEDKESPKSDEVKENFHLTKLTSLPPLKNDPATRRPFKPGITLTSYNLGQLVIILMNFAVVCQSSSSQMVDQDEKIKIRNPFAKVSAVKIMPESQDEIGSEFQAYSQTPVEIRLI
jgi:hypothetical protein